MHHGSLAQSSSYEVAVKAVTPAHASAIRRLLHGVRDVAEMKVVPMFFTSEMSHKSSPTPANLDEKANVSFNVLTFATFHPLRSAFISPAE